MLMKCASLEALDVSGCTKFCGLAFHEIDDAEYVSKKLKWLQVNLEGHEMNMCKERVNALVPNCQIVLQQKRLFNLII